MRILLKNAAIFGGDRADILVEDGEIVGIGAFALADRVIDMGRYAAVMPGFIDAHMHFITGEVPYSDFALKLWAQAGVTTVRDLGIGNSAPDHPIREVIEWREKSLTPESAQLLTCGRFVSEYGGYGHKMMVNETGFGCRTVEDCVDTVNMLIDAGCDGIKTAVDRGDPVFGGLKPLLPVEKLKAIADTAKARGVWCCAHVLEADLVPRLLDAGMPQLAHMPLDRVDDEVLARLAEQKVPVTPTLSTIDRPRPPLPNGAKLPPLPEGVVPPPPPDTKAQERVCVDNVARFVKLGGMVALGTDAMRMEIQPELAAMPVRELQLMREAGLSIEQVVEASTKNAAIVCGIGDEVGTIEVGKRANIIAVRDEIDDTFEALGHVEFVMNQGVVIREA